MKILIAILLIISSAIILANLIIFIWTFDMFYFRIWATALITGFLLMKLLDTFKKD